MRPIVPAILALAVLAACSRRADTAVRPSLAVTPNPPRCSTIVARRLAGEFMTVQEGAKFDSRITPPAEWPRSTWGREVSIQFLLTERGTVDSASVRVWGVDDPRFAEMLGARVLPLRARPGRYEGCWVPSRQSYRFPVRKDGKLPMWYGP